MNESHESSLMSVKLNADFFLHERYGENDVCQFYTEVVDLLCRRAMLELSEALDLVREMPDVDAEPPYNAIQNKFKKVVALIGGKPQYPLRGHIALNNS